MNERSKGGWEAARKMAHKHEWINAAANGHSSGDGSGRLMTINQYCECGAVATLTQSASNADWHRTIEPARVILDDDGNPLGTAWDFGCA